MRTLLKSAKVALIIATILPLSAVFLTETLKAESIIAPSRNSVVTELWRWRELDDLKNIETFYATIDKNGALWLPNYDGINFYNGIKVTKFPYPKSFKPSFPNGVHVTKTGDVFVSTENGLRKLSSGIWKMVYDYNKVQDLRIVKFAELDNGRVYARSPNGLLEINGDTVRVVPHTPTRIINITTFENSLWFSNAHDNVIYRIPFDSNGELVSSPPQTYKISEKPSHRTVLLSSSKHGLIAGNTSHKCGLLRYDPTVDNWANFTEQSAPSQNHDLLTEASDGSIVIHTTGNLIIYHNNTWTSIPKEIQVPKSFPFIVASQDKLIVGGFREPIQLIDTSDKRWAYFPKQSFQCQDKLERSWFINSDKQVVVHNPAKDQWTNFGINEGIIDNPVRVYCSENNLKWVVGSHQNKAAVSIYENGKWSTHIHEKLGTTIERQSIFETKEHEILFGSGDIRRVRKHDKGGVVIYTLINGEYEFKYLSPPKVPNHIISLVKKENTYWFGGQKFYQYSQGKLETVFLDDVSNTRSLWIDNLTITEEGTIWCSQRGNGVLKYTNDQWIHFKEDSGLASDNILAIAGIPGNHTEDIYTVTDKGLVYFDGSVWSPIIMKLPFQADRSNISIRVLKDRSLWINNDVIYPTSQSIDVSNHTHNENTSIRWCPQKLTVDTLISTNPKKIVQPANLIIQWSAKSPWSNTSQEDMMFSYRFNRGNWSEFTIEKQKVFFDLSAGVYELEVRSRDLDGNIDNTPATVRFQVILPMWKQPWFIVASLTILTVLITLIILIIKQRFRHIIALEEFKIQFFTNLSHELRTPLTVILGPLESLLNKSTDDLVREKASIAHRSALKMQKLVDQLLEFRKIETTQSPDNLTKDNIIRLIHEEIEMINPLIQEKDQSIEFISSVETAFVCLDFEKMRMVLDNLLSNASKYTQPGGKIIVELQFNSKARSLFLSVTDNGSGIHVKELKNIFNPFHRAPGKEHVSGTGIGLSLVKALVTSMKGSISVESDTSGSEKGTKFSIQIPESKGIATTVDDLSEKSTDIFSSEDRSNKDLLLLVEDNAEIRSFLKTELENDFKIEEASNGKIALQKAKALIPDLILTDIMMPEMDGKELCSRIKQSELCAHIPVIMLTALGSKQHQLHAFEAGADDFITKPIDIHILRKKLQNQTQLRDALHHKFLSENHQQIDLKSDAPIEGPSERFLARVQKIISEEIDNENFDLDEFAHKMNMSKMTLHRKIKAISGISPAAYLRNIRLSEAAKLLKSGHYNVSEVIHLVGFNDLSHFGSLFKKKFGVSPSEYR